MPQGHVFTRLTAEDAKPCQTVWVAQHNSRGRAPIALFITTVLTWPHVEVNKNNRKTFIHSSVLGLQELYVPVHLEPY